MARFDSLLVGSDFAVGSTYDLDYYPGDQINRRIVLNVTFDRAETIPMIVDTGSAWCILDPQLYSTRPLIKLFSSTLRNPVVVRQ